MSVKQDGECPFEDCYEVANMPWPGDNLPILEDVADYLRRPDDVAGLWACEPHAGLLSAILEGARSRLDGPAAGAA